MLMLDSAIPPGYNHYGILSGGVAMERNYTEAVKDGFFDLIENDTVEIWKNLDRSVAMIKSGKWKEHYSEVVAKYRFSSRFAIMRILFEKATRLPPSKTDEQALTKGFSVSGIGNFPNITIKHAKEMAAAEVDLYRQLLLQRVEENNPDSTQEALGLVSDILELPSAGTKCKLTRDELIRLGHMVDFSLEEMQFLLLRVLGDNEAGFNYSSSMDIIDMFGFINHLPLTQIGELKAWYRQNASNLKKVEYADKPAYCTQDIANSLDQAFAHWIPEEQAKKFKTWLLQQAPYLDVKSKTVQKIYINLAAYAYIRAKKMNSNMGNIVTENFYADMENIAFGKAFRDYHDYAKQLFFEDSKPNLEKCETIAAELIYENAEYAGDFHTHDNNSELLYHVLHVEKGNITARGKLNKDSKKWIIHILMGKTTPLKSDLLYLLWFVANDHWIGKTATDDEKTQFLDDFLAAASCLLEAAFLPEFYPPNILEETLILSIALGDKAKTPAMVYESICSAFTDKGKVKKPLDAKAKTPEIKKEIALFYYDLLVDGGAKEDCKKKTSEHFCVGKASVENYYNQYVAQYYYDHLTKYADETICREACAEKFFMSVASVKKWCDTYPKGLE